MPPASQKDATVHEPGHVGRRRALLLGGGELTNSDRVRQRLANVPFDLVVCADSGLRHAAPLGVTPTHVVGDFDSLAPDWEALAAGAKISRFPADKDKTDLHLAVDLAVADGATDLVIAGATGGRLDHLLGNVLLLPELTQGGLRATLIDGWNEAWIAAPVSRFDAAAGQIVSLVPLSAVVTGVVVRGLRYELTDATLTWGSTLSISNEGVGRTAEVRHRAGTLLIVRALGSGEEGR